MRKRILISCLVLAACDERSISVGDLQEVMVLPAVPNPNLDILFVIDTSPSMLDEQEAMIASFPRMMDVLATLDGGLPNVHIGVVTTDMGVQNSSDAILAAPVGSGPGDCAGPGDDGQLRGIPELGSAAYISDIAAADGTRVRNYTGELRDIFTKLATVGAEGCGFEQPLAAMRRALDNPANAGFLRDEANLAVVILTDEDDCSAAHQDLFDADTSLLGPLHSFRCTQFGVTCDQGGGTTDAMAEPGSKVDCHTNATSALVDDVTGYVDLLQNLKGDPNAVMVAAIVGDPDLVAVELGPSTGGGIPAPRLSPACSSALGSADPAVRIAQLVAAFPNRGVVTSICDDDLGLPLTSIGYAAKKLVGDPCLEVSLLDTSPAEGLQPICNVLEGPHAAEQPMPSCDTRTTSNCWRLVPDSSLCATSPHQLRFEVVRAQAPAPRTYAHLRCMTP